VCGRLYDEEPLPDCCLADHIEAHAALFPKADVKQETAQEGDVMPAARGKESK